MLPTRYTVLDEAAITRDGQLDPTALAEAPSLAAQGPRTAARAEIEARLAALVGEILGRSGVRTTDNFFVLGGDLTLGAELVTRANGAGIALAPQSLLAGPTIAELAEAAETLGEPAPEEQQDMPAPDVSRPERLRLRWNGANIAERT